MSHILIVDDEPQNCHDIASMLEGLDVNLMYCHRSENALAHIREIEPSLVLLDADMPNMDGYQVINQMWSDDDLRQIPVLLMTSHFADRKQLLHQPLLEVVDALPKPINPDLLIERVKMALTLKAHQKSIVAILDDGGQAIRKRHEGVLGVDQLGRITFANATALALLRTNHQMIFGVHLESIFEEPNHQVKSAWLEHPLHKVCSQGNVLQVESCQLYCADGTMIQVKMAAIPLDRVSELSMVIAFRQIKGESASEFTEENEQQVYMQQYDPLTGTYTRTAFEQVIDDRLKQGESSTRKMAVIQVDLAHFNHVNESLGHEVGDRMLKDVVARLRKSLRPTDRIGRIGGDVFALLVDDVQSHKNAGSIAQKIIEALKESFLLEGYELYIGCSLGIATYPECGKNSGALLKNAAIAVQGAKLVGTNSYKFFTAQMNAEILARVELESSLRHSLERGELEANVVPILVTIESNTLSKTAELYRLCLSWQHQKFGTSNTAELMNLFERFGLTGLYKELLASVISQFEAEAGPNVILIVPITLKGLLLEGFAEKMAASLTTTSNRRVGWAIQEEGFSRLNHDTGEHMKRVQSLGFLTGMDTEAGASLIKAYRHMDLDFVLFTGDLEDKRQQKLIQSSINLASEFQSAVVLQPAVML